MFKKAKEVSNKLLLPGLAAYSNVISLNKSSLGLVFLLCTIFHLNIALSGLIAVIFATFLLRLLDTDKTPLIQRMFLYNGLLVGLLIGYLFQLELSSVVLILCSTLLTLLSTLFLDAILKPQLLPVLSLPFITVGSCVILATRNFTNLTDATPYFINNPFLLNFLPPFLITFFRSLGSAFCVPDSTVGAGIFFATMVHSPLTAIFLLLGFTEGYLLESFFAIGQIEILKEYHYFNYSLVFTAISGVFFVPSRFSILLAALGTLLTALLSAAALNFWTLFHVPILSLPYNVLVILIIRGLRQLKPESLNTVFSGSPEKTLDSNHLLKHRYRSHEVGIYCPFEGAWTVQQGFRGSWTHKGNWENALDFVVTDTEGKTYRNQGIELTDYYTFGKEVCSPVEGYVIHCHSTHLDHAIGSVDNQNNWGNFILLKSLGGIYVLLAHLKKDSILVKLGDHVNLGQKLARVGNTGYSQEPHLHLQVQLTPELGAFPIPFHLLNYLTKNRLWTHGTPNQDDQVLPIPLNFALSSKLRFRLGDTMDFKVTIDGQPSQQIRLTHDLEPHTGSYYWTEGRTKLYYFRTGAMFYFYGIDLNTATPIRDLFLCMPKVPMTFGEPFDFEDVFSLTISESLLGRWKKAFSKLIFKTHVHHFCCYHMNPTLLTIEGEARLQGKKQKTYCKLDPQLGILEFQIGNRKYTRVP